VPSSLSLQRELQSERFYNFHSSVKVAPRERRSAAIDLLSRSRGGFSTKILGQKIEGLVASTYILPIHSPWRGAALTAQCRKALCSPYI
jgi:hypothetical protein